ncbi:MAG: DUF1489 domain-containing protein [Alphaproteobacteria bacterium]|nr:DUF1489 domain-containing protein [Alphaproteobacteria bacterium]
MTLNLIKLCVGIDSIEHLQKVQKQRRGRRKVNYHYTRQMPQRGEEIVGRGSIYWVIKGFIRVRQPILALDIVHLEEEGRHCRISLDPALVAVEPTPFRAFQGWRYLEPKDAPPDLKGGGGKARAAMPPELIAELKQLGLL